MPQPHHTSPHMHLAHSKLLQLGKGADYSHSNGEEKLVHARILGYLIREGPSTKAKEHVAQVNSSKPGKQKIGLLGLSGVLPCQRQLSSSGG